MTGHSIRRPDGAKTVQVGPGLTIDAPLEVEFRDFRGYDVTATIEPQGGRLVATDLHVRQRAGGPPVTIEGIRSLSIASMIREVAERELVEVGQGTGIFSVTSKDLTRELIAELVAEGPTERTLRTVAYLYRHAVAVGDPPTKLVETALGLSRSKAGRWIALAREHKHLGPSEGAGKASG